MVNLGSGYSKGTAVIAGVLSLAACKGDATSVGPGTGGDEVGQVGGGTGAGGSSVEDASVGGSSNEPPPADNFNLGPSLRVGELNAETAEVPVWDATGGSGISGVAYLQQSRLAGNGPVPTAAELVVRDQALCVSGTTVIVPNMNYTEYWGAEITLDLNRPAAALGAPTTADAGSDAAASDVAPTQGSGGSGGQAGSGPPPMGLRAAPWDPRRGRIIGVSFVVDGNDPTLFESGIPPVLRLEGVPMGANPATDVYCNPLPNVVSGQRRSVLFADMLESCWEPGGAGIIAEPLPPEHTGEILFLSWLVPADALLSYMFDLCVRDIQPILAE